MSLDWLDKPNSVPAPLLHNTEVGLGTIIYLGLLLPAASSGTQEPGGSSTALHRGKDLAVSFSVSPQRFISKRCPLLSLRTSLFAPRASLRTGVTRYLADQCFRTA